MICVPQELAVGIRDLAKRYGVQRHVKAAGKEDLAALQLEMAEGGHDLRQAAVGQGSKGRRSSSLLSPVASRCLIEFACFVRVHQ